VDKLKGKQKENVIAFEKQARLSKILATIILDAPIDLNETDLVYEEPNEEKVIEVFSELEFRTLLSKVIKNPEASLVPNTASANKSNEDNGQMSLFGGASDAVIAENNETFKNIESVTRNYQLIEDTAALIKLVKELNDQSAVCFDTETTGLDDLNAKLLGIAISWKKGEGYYISMPKEINARKEFKQLLGSFFENEKIEKIAHNIKYDLSILKNEKIEVKGKLFDTMIAHYLLEPDQRHGMDYLSETYLQYKPVSIETLTGPKGKNQKNMADIPPQDVSEYACEDADVTYQLYEIFKEKIENSYLHQLFYDVEMPLARVLLDMEREGIYIDSNALNEFS
jgi:DNA polymerase-1